MMSIKLYGWVRMYFLLSTSTPRYTWQMEMLPTNEWDVPKSKYVFIWCLTLDGGYNWSQIIRCYFVLLVPKMANVDYYHYALCSLVGHVRRILNEKWIMECCRSIIVLHQLLANENVTHIHSHTYTHIYSTYTHNRSVVFRHDACLPLSEQ